MKRITYKNSLIKLASLMFFILLFTQCRKDEDENYRILIENHCDFGIKVYYDNQDIEYYGGDFEEIDVIGAVTFVGPYEDKVVFSKYTSVWVEPEVNLRARKFRSYNDGPWRKKIIVMDEDFY